MDEEVDCMISSSSSYGLSNNEYNNVTCTLDM